MQLLCFLFGCITSISLFTAYDYYKENITLKLKLKHEEGENESLRSKLYK